MPMSIEASATLKTAKWCRNRKSVTFLKINLSKKFPKMPPKIIPNAISFKGKFTVFSMYTMRKTAKTLRTVRIVVAPSNVPKTAPEFLICVIEKTCGIRGISFPMGINFLTQILLP
jgi:hypothetical protein